MKLPYFKIKKATEEARSSFAFGSGADKITSTAKLLGKSVANIGMFAVEIGIEAIKNLPEETGKKAKELLRTNIDSMSEEQIEVAKRAVELGEEAKERRLEKERQERQERE